MNYIEVYGIKWNTMKAMEAMEAMGTMAATDRQLLFLPMAHVFAKVLEVAIIKMGIGYT